MGFTFDFTNITIDIGGEDIANPNFSKDNVIYIIPLNHNSNNNSNNPIGSIKIKHQSGKWTLRDGQVVTYNNKSFTWKMENGKIKCEKANPRNEQKTTTEEEKIKETEEKIKKILIILKKTI